MLAGTVRINEEMQFPLQKRVALVEMLPLIIFYAFVSFTLHLSLSAMTIQLA
jgi:hypothetical protein